MLVTGGWDIVDMKTHKTKRFDSTELLVPGARSWRVVGALPMPIIVYLRFCRFTV